jgi:predicted metal-binding membrane protein
MSLNRILVSLLVVGSIVGLKALADDQSSSQKTEKSGSSAPSDPSPPATHSMDKGMMGNGPKAKGAVGGMMGQGMMAGAMKDSAAKMIQMHQRMLEEVKAQDADNDKLVTEMNQATGKRKVDIMASLLSRLVAQQKSMHKKMSSMHADMMQMMTGGISDAVHESSPADKGPAPHDQSSLGESSQS